jgi:predicted kinase
MVYTSEMEALVLIGIPGSGKSTYYRRHLVDTHVRISLDMLGTKHRQTTLLTACVNAKISFVVDNTNVTRSERRPFILAAEEAGMAAVGLFFESKIEECLARNELRSGSSRLPTVGVRGRRNELELPSLTEGFARLSFVRIDSAGVFDVTPWRS